MCFVAEGRQPTQLNFIFFQIASDVLI